MTRGKVKFYNEQKGYGFIRPDEGGDDVFVHATDLQKQGVDFIEKGDIVEFTTRDAKRGIQVDLIQLA